MKAVAFGLVSVVLAGCSTTQPTVIGSAPQYCYTTQEIVTDNGNTVKSSTQVSCSDDPVQRVTSKRLGMSKHCGEYSYWMNIGGNDVQRTGISCQRPDGSWEVINPYPIQY